LRLLYLTRKVFINTDREIIMHKLLTSLFAALMLMQANAFAATTSGNFNVTVTLTSACTIGTIGDLAFGTYTAFQSSALTATATTATLTCTRGLSGVTANFDTVAPGATAAAAATNAVGAGVIGGLQYDITATPGSVTPGTAATASSIGTGDTRPYSITGSMPANQAGTAPGGATTQQRTLTVNY
jgi:spore coat protein U-like protein